MNFSDFADSNWLSVIVVLIALQAYLVAYVWAQAIAGWILHLKVATISIGFGPRLLRVQLFGADCSWSIISISGYTKFAGDSSDESPSAQIQLRPRSQKILISSVGPLSNLALALIVLTGALWIGGLEPEFMHEPVRIGWCKPGSALQQAGLARGDEILTANYGGSTVQIESWQKLLKVLSRATGRTLQLGCRRGTAEFSLNVYLRDTALYDVCHNVPPTVGAVKESSPGSQAGFKVGDTIVQVNGKTLEHWLDLEDTLSSLVGSAAGNQPLDVSVQRGTGLILLNVPREKIRKNTKEFGLQPARAQAGNVPKSLRSAFAESIKTELDVVATGARALLRQGEYASTFDRSNYEVIDKLRSVGGFSSLVPGITTAGLALCVFNLVPLPPLNGGIIALDCLALVLSLMGVAMSTTLRERIQQVGSCILLLAMVFVVVLFFRS